MLPLAFLIPLLAYGQSPTVVFDDSFGAVTLEPDFGDGGVYQILDSYGEKAGGNLFHSFQTFGVSAGDTATFEVGAGVENVISRVTGGLQSDVYGTINVDQTVGETDANFWMINSAGFVVHDGAEIDIGGIFNSSDADYIEFSSTDRLYSTTDSSVSFSVDPTEFGFLDDVTFDATLGAVTTPGDFGKNGNYQIEEDIGTKNAANLFYSFDKFSVPKNGSVTFQVGGGITNVISRVTGGSPSIISGAISVKDIDDAGDVIADVDPLQDGANFWMINPAGWTELAGSSYDIGAGLFEVGAADYIRFGGNERLYLTTEDFGPLSTSPLELGFYQDIAFDKSIGTHSSDFAPDASGNYLIEQGRGQKNGTNLFHSFETFSVPAGASALFQADSEIVHVISRVTGPLESEIDGLIEVQGGVGGLGSNFWFINPAGITFQDGARIDVGSMFDFNVGVAGSISLAGAASYLADRTKEEVGIDFTGIGFAGNPVNLSVANLSDQDGSLLLEGVYFIHETSDFSNLRFLGGQVDLTSNSTISTFADVNSTKISIIGNNVTLKDSQIYTGTNSLLDGGSIDVFAAHGIVLKDQILSATSDDDGNAGSIRLSTGISGTITLNTSTLQSFAFNEGDAGSISVGLPLDEVTDAPLFDGETGAFQASGASASVIFNGATLRSDVLPKVPESLVIPSGDSGSITIAASNEVTLNTNGGANQTFITAESYGEGNAGNITIAAGGKIVANEGEGFFGAGVAIGVDSKKAYSGRVGDILIQAPIINLNRAIFGVDSFSELTNPAGKIELIATTEVGNTDSGSLTLTNFLLRSGTWGNGNAGATNASSVKLVGDSIVLNDSSGWAGGGGIRAQTGGRGNAGEVRIEGNTIELTGVSILDENTVVERIGGVVQTDGPGKKKKIPFEDTDLSQRINLGSPGRVTINGTESVSLSQSSISTLTIGENTDPPQTSINITSIKKGLSGEIESRGIVILSDSELTAETLAGSPAGDIEVLGDSISLNSSDLFATTSGSGAAGSILIEGVTSITANTDSGVTLDSNNIPNGNNATSFYDLIYGPEGGDGPIEDPAMTNIKSSSSESTSGRAGDITIRANRLDIRGGNVASTTRAIPPEGKEHEGATILLEASDGDLDLINTLVRADSFGTTDAGNIKISAESLSEDVNARVLFARSRAVSDTWSSGNAGTIDVTGDVVILNGSFIGEDATFIQSQSNAGTGEAGDINILGRAGVYANKDDREKYGLYTAISSQSNSTFSGKAGIVKISTDSGGEINLANTVITAATDSDEALNLPGEITLMAEDGDLVLLESVVRAETFGNSPAAGILLSAYDITYSGGKGASSSVEAPSIKSSTEGAGAAGDIKVFGSNKTILDNVILASTTQFGGGDAGLIQIGNALVNELGEVIASSSVVEIRNGTTISATGGGTGRAGTVQIFGKDSITIDASTLESSTKGSENGGDITIGAWLGEDNQPIDYSEQVILKENTVVEGKTTSEGDAANISVFGNEITLDSGVSIVTNTERSSTAANPQGDAGNINILAGNYSEDGEFLWGQIRSNASLDDNPVTISSDSFFAHLMMNEEGQFELVLKENPSEIERAGLGIAGNVSLQAGTIELNDANIAATTASNVATIERNDVGEIISDNSASVKIVAHTDALTLIDVAVTVSTSGKSSAGSINVFGPLATTLDSATLESSTSGAGDAGLVTVGAQLDEDRQIVNYSDVVTLKNDSLISGTTSGSGVAGTINLFGNTISLSNGTEITSTTSSGGAAGDIAIKAGQADAGDIFVWGLLESIASPGNPIRISSDSVVLQQKVDGTGAPILDDEGKVQLVENENPSEAERDGLGIAGDVSIQAGEIDLTDANIAATTAGNTTTIEKNDAGEVISDTSASVSIVANTDALTLTDVEVAVSTSGRSSAGSINVFGPLATTLDSATLESSTSGAGDAGLVTVGAQLDEDRQIVNYSDVVTLKNDSLISGTTSGSGVAGTINLFGNTISLSNGTEITSTTSSGGAAGDIAIKAGQADAGDIFVWGLLESIASPGNPIRISSDSIVLQQEVDGTGAPILDDEGKVQLVESENPSESERDGLGIAGNVSIQAGKIELNDASIAATTASNTITLVKDDAGEVISDSSASVTLFAATEALILNDVEVAVSTSGKSTAGSIDIFSTDSIALNGSTVIEATTTGLGNAGSIELESNTITTRGDADERVTIASESLLSDSGAPGAITLLANTIDLLNTDVRGTTATNTPHPDASASVKIAATDGDLTLESTLLEVSTSGANNAGELQLAGQNIVVRGDAKISSTTSSSGNAGSFSLGSAAAKVDNVTLEGGATLTATTSGSGDAGNISINARSIIARGDATNLVNIVTESENESSGAAGSIELLGDVIELANTRISATTASNALDSSPASVRLTAAAGDLILNSSVVEVSSTGSSAAGTIDLSGVALELQDTTVSSATSAEGDAGLIALVGADDSEIDRISLREGTTITATTSGAGNAGSIEVIGKHIESRDASIISESTVVDASGEAIDPSTITADQRAGVGAAGDLLIDASESLDLVGGEFKTRTVSDDPEAKPSTITINSGGDLRLSAASILADTFGASSAGQISVRGSAVNLESGTTVNTTTEGAGNAGSIEIAGNSITTKGDIENRVVIASESPNSDSGAPGAISLLAGSIDLADTDIRGTTATDVLHPLASASVTILANQGDLNLERTLLEVSTSGANDAGKLDVVGRNIVLRDATISSTTSAAGNAGSFSLGGVVGSDVDSVILEGGATLTATTSGSGRAGDILVNANTITALGDANNLVNIVTESQNESSGAAGSISLIGGAIDLTNARVSGTTASDVIQDQPAKVNLLATDADLVLQGAVVEVSTSGASSAGTIEIAGTHVALRDSIVSSTTSGTGAAGSVSLVGSAGKEIQSITLEEGTTLTATTSGAGDAGSITIQGNSITAPASEGGDRVTIASASAVFDAQGNEISPTPEQAATLGAAGSILLTGNSIELANINISGTTASDLPQETPASVRLIATLGDLSLLGGAEVKVSTSGASSAGTIGLSGTNVELRDTTVSSTTSGAGDAGSIAVVGEAGTEIESLSLQDGSTLTATTSGSGNAGSISVAARRVTGSGASIISESAALDAQGVAIDPSLTALTAEQRAGVGAAGSVLINGSDSVLLEDGLYKTRTVSDQTSGTRSRIEITSAGEIRLTGAEVVADTFADSDAGEILLHGRTVSLENNATINTTTAGLGAAGSVDIIGSDGVLADGATVLSQSANATSGAAGSITFGGASIALDNIQISATTNSDNLDNTAASVDMRTTSGDIALLASQVETSTAGASEAGNVFLEAANITLSQGSSIAASTFGAGNAGGVQLNTLASVVTLNDATIQAQSTGSGAGGGIAIDAGTLILVNGSIINSEASGSGAAGNINIDLHDDLSIVGSTGLASKITTNSAESAGGDIFLSVDGAFFMNHSVVEATAGADGNGGDIDISADSIIMAKSGILARADAGNGGSISLAITGANQLLILDTQSVINADSGSGSAGLITITAPDVDLDSGLQEQEVAFSAPPELAPDACIPTNTGAQSTFSLDDEGGTPISPDRYFAATAQTETAPVVAQGDFIYAAIARELLASNQRGVREGCR